MHHWALLIVGAMILALNLLTVCGPLLAWKLRAKHPSPVCVPFVSPIALTAWPLCKYFGFWYA